MTTAYLALGSNLGERGSQLEQALHLLHGVEGVEVVNVSSSYETEAVGGPAGQGLYLNAACEIRTDLDAPMLLKLLHVLEGRLGRVRETQDGPRTLDLDLLLYGSEIIDANGLHVPHPRLQDRFFVLDPLVEIAANVKHPVFDKTMAELREALVSRSQRVGARRTGRDLNGLRALVTGSTSGIGRAIAAELASAGADVVIHGRRSALADEVAHLCRHQGVRSETIVADVADAEACQTLLERGWALWQGLDIWVNNAGADTLTGEAAKWPFEKKLDALWQVDVLGTMRLARGIGKRMKTRGQGVVVTIGWDQAETGMEGDSGQLFSATKGAVMAFTKSLALSLAPQVRVNCVAPGWIRTAWGEGASTPWQERVRRETPLEKWGTPEDIANAVHWLVRPASHYVTGQIVRVNGGAVRG